MKINGDMRALAAANLLSNCAKLTSGDRLVIAVENPREDHYCPKLGPLVASAAQQMGIETQLIEVPFRENIQAVPDDLEAAMETAHCTIFFARLGDQLRFGNLGRNRRVVVCYALDEPMLMSSFGWAHHDAFATLKRAIDQAFGRAKHIRVTCPAGTDFEGPGYAALPERESDVSIARFPLSVFAPVPADGFSGRMVQRGFLTGTCSRFYKPYAVELEGALTVEFSDNRITGFKGSTRDVRAAQNHYDAVASRFGIDRDFVHSWHVGIHPGCAYDRPAAQNYERWCSGAFGNPRVLHFHTCGAYAPGEISINVVDPTVELDGVKIWENGRLYPDRVTGGADVLTTYPCAQYAFDHPATAIGF